MAVNLVHDGAVVDVSKFLKDDDAMVGWICLVDAGVPVKGDDNWFSTKKDHFPLFNGYRAARVVKSGNGDFFKVLCSIKKSSLGIPIFNCESYRYIPDERKFSGECSHSLSLKKITTLSNSFLQKLGVPTKKSWYGLKFFGLDRKDVRSIQNRLLDSSNQIKSINQSNQPSTSDNEDPTIIHDDSISYVHCYNFLGVKSFGKMVEGQFKEFYYHKYSDKTLYIPDGYISKWVVKCNIDDKLVNKSVECHVSSSGSVPIYKCVTDIGSFVNLDPTRSVKDALTAINCIGKKKWSGFDFFGFHNKGVIEKLLVRNSPSAAAKHDILKDIANIHHRHSGPTSEMKDKRSIEKRNEKINSVVELASQGDIQSYVSFLLDNYPEIIDESIKESEGYKKHLVKVLMKNPPGVTLSQQDSASLLMSKTSLTEREYKAVRDNLRKQNVRISSYEEVSSYIKHLDIGTLNGKFCQCDHNCMSSGSNVYDTLKILVNSPFWYDKLQFMDSVQSNKLFDSLLEISPYLYGNLDPMKRTLFIRMTGDNFRAACKYPTEQISYSLLNNSSMLHSPYGQFLSSLWRGSENRENINSHAIDYHKEMEQLLLNGGEFILPDGTMEIFNIIPIVCADLGFVKDLLGKCSSSGLYGCYYCKKSIKMWDDSNGRAEAQTMAQMLQYGRKGVEVLGENPDHQTKEFTAFQQSHLGQYAVPLFEGFELFLMPPCGLHLILAHHRYLWSHVIDVIVRRKQEGLIKKAFTAIDCHFLALQFESYFKSKNKLYDGSPTLKMIGEDCKQLEKNIGKFISFFIPEGADIKDKSCEKLRGIITLYKLFAEIASDIRSVEYNSDRAHSFSKRVEIYYEKFRQYAASSCSSRKPYMHILREHVGDIMIFWGEHLGWGYGYFNCNAGEHLNKRIKCMEYGVTNMKDDRFMCIMRFMRVKQFHFPEQLLPSTREMTCSACKQRGHNKKNKNCPLHPSQVDLVFSDTDDDEI